MNLSEDLHERLTYYAASWNLELGERWVETPSSVLAFGKWGQKSIILKIIKPNSDEYNSGRWLDYHSGRELYYPYDSNRGAVAVFAFNDQAVLMEQIQPGTELVELVRAGRDEEAIIEICRVIKLLHPGSPFLPDGFPEVEDWGQAFVRNSREVLTAKIPAELLDKAHEMYEELCASQGPRHLLHGDLHHYNVLQNATKGWQAIDPKGVIGEMAYETGAMLRNPIEMPDHNTKPDTIRYRVKIICRELGLEEKRVLGWSFAQAVLSAVWTIEDGGPDSDITRILKLAENTLALLNEA